MSEKREVEPGCGFIFALSLMFAALLACAISLEKIAKLLAAMVPK